MARIEVKSRKLGQTLVFATRGQYVYVNDRPGGFCDKQLFDRHGNAVTINRDLDEAHKEAALEKIARQYIGRFA